MIIILLLIIMMMIVINNDTSKDSDTMGTSSIRPMPAVSKGGSNYASNVHSNFNNNVFAICTV
jgi:hypothetical protein